MTPNQVAKLFKLKSCYLVGKVHGNPVPLMRGPFQAMLTAMYMTYPMKDFHIELPDGTTYPNYAMKEKNERN